MDKYNSIKKSSVMNTVFNIMGILYFAVFIGYLAMHLAL